MLSDHQSLANGHSWKTLILCPLWCFRLAGFLILIKIWRRLLAELAYPVQQNHVLSSIFRNLHKSVLPSHLGSNRWILERQDPKKSILTSRYRTYYWRGSVAIVESASQSSSVTASNLAGLSPYASHSAAACWRSSVVTGLGSCVGARGQTSSQRS